MQNNCGKMLLALCVLAFAVMADSGWAATQAVETPTAKTLLLDSGETVRLAAIQAPNRARNAQEQDDPLARQAHAYLQQLVAEKPLTIEPISKDADRHGRIVARVYADGKLLQAEMLRAGLAWVYTFPDTRDMAATLLAAEREAEAAHRGVWAEPAYAVLTAENASKGQGRFRLVEGTVRQVAEVRGRYYLNFGADWKTDFTVLIEKDHAKAFDAAWLQSLEGKHIRVRGWLFALNGPAIEITHPEQLELRP